MVVGQATADLCPVDVNVSEQRRLHCIRHGNSAFIYGDRVEDPRDAAICAASTAFSASNVLTAEALEIIGVSRRSAARCRRRAVDERLLNRQHGFEIAPLVVDGGLAVDVQLGAEPLQAAAPST